MIEKIVQALRSATRLPVKPLSTTDNKECILYNLFPQTDDGAVATHRLELRLITKTVEDADHYRKLIIETLVNSGDNIKINGIYNCDLNGGGQEVEFETNTIHTFLYFNLVTRSLN